MCTHRASGQKIVTEEPRYSAIKNSVGPLVSDRLSFESWACGIGTQTLLAIELFRGKPCRADHNQRVKALRVLLPQCLGIGGGHSTLTPTDQNIWRHNGMSEVCKNDRYPVYWQWVHQQSPTYGAWLIVILRLLSRRKGNWQIRFYLPNVFCPTGDKRHQEFLVAIFSPFRDGIKRSYSIDPSAHVHGVIEQDNYSVHRDQWPDEWFNSYSLSMEPKGKTIWL